MTTYEYALEYTATETANEFHADNSQIRLLKGAVGCGKSVANCMEIFIRASQQEPGYDGIRRSRWAIIRNTYPELKSTTIVTWKSWFPEDKFGKIKFDSPINQLIRVNDIHLEIVFIALDSPDDVKKLKSLELTGIYINELQYIDKFIFDECRERINRYPSKKEGAKITWTGIIADTNPPDTRHWIYRVFEVDKPQGFKLFNYISPLIKLKEVPTDIPYAISSDGGIYINNEKADYREVQNDPDYWIKLVPGSKDEKIKVNLMGEYGVIISGKPVHPTYNDTYHYSNRIIPYNPAIELGFGWDFGLTPAVAIAQLSPRGQLLVIDELWSYHMGLRDFVRDVVLPHLLKHFSGWENNFFSTHDPSGSTGSQTDGKNCEDILIEFGITSLPAITNDATPRRDGLKYFLGKMVDGQPALALSSKVQMIREGLMGRFQYARVKAGGEERYHEKPLKNLYSHICEGFEYIAMHYASEIKTIKSEKDERAYEIYSGNFMGI